MIKRKAYLPQAWVIALVAATALAWSSSSSGADMKLTQGTSDQQASTMKIRMTVEGIEVIATLSDTPTSRDFASLLPFTLTLRDYGSTEKISDLPRNLTTREAPPGFDPSVGDITYYAPWENLAVFYKDFGYSKGLINLGKIDSGVEALNRPGPLKVTIERIH